MTKRFAITVVIILVVGILALGYYFAKSKTETVELFFYNEQQDVALDGEVSCSLAGIAPVTRTINTIDPIGDTIRLLIAGEITPQEIKKGYSSEFPNSQFRLISDNLDKDGTLTLRFTEVPGFTDGGSCRVGILAEEIRQTALQFKQVKQVVFEPAELFQP